MKKPRNNEEPWESSSKLLGWERGWGSQGRRREGYWNDRGEAPKGICSHKILNMTSVSCQSTIPCVDHRSVHFPLTLGNTHFRAMFLSLLLPRSPGLLNSSGLSNILGHFCGAADTLRSLLYLRTVWRFQNAFCLHWHLGSRWFLLY